MSRKIKAKQNTRVSRGLGYLSVMLLVAAALIIGAAHEPLKKLLGTFTDRDESSLVQPPVQETELVSSKSEIEKPQQLESVITSKTDLTILKVTIADSMRIEYILVPSSIGVDANHRRAIYAITCALQNTGKVRRSVVFVGVGRFIDSAGQPTLRSRAETRLTALRLNQVECSHDTSARDIDWNGIADYDIKFAIPRGYKVDI